MGVWGEVWVEVVLAVDSMMSCAQIVKTLSRARRADLGQGMCWGSLCC